MAKHKYSNEEVAKWQKEHNQHIFYVNKNDSNLAVRRISGGGTLNLAHPVSWIIILAWIAIICLVIFHKAIFG